MGCDGLTASLVECCKCGAVATVQEACGDWLLGFYKGEVVNAVCGGCGKGEIVLCEVNPALCEWLGNPV